MAKKKQKNKAKNSKAVSKSAKKPAAKKAVAKKPLAKAKTVAPKAASSKKINLSQLISPLDDRVLVQVQAQERVTAGGLIIPDTAQLSGNQRAIVVAVGRGHRDPKGRLRPLELRIGDEILLPEHSGDFIQVAGQEVKILRESEILGIVE